MSSVIIVNYFSADLIGRALRSVISEPHVEVFIVDNTCTPEEEERLRQVATTYDLKVIQNSKNVGFAAANNQAFSMSQREYVLLLNPDAFVLPGCIKMMTAFLDQNPKAAAISPMVYWDDGMRYFFPRYPYPSPFRGLFTELALSVESLSKLYSFHERKKNLELWRSAAPVEVKNLHGGVMMVRRSSIKTVGKLFDERFFMFYEDTDLCLRLRRKGYKLYILPGAKAVHNYRHSEKKLERMAEALQLYYKKHYDRNILKKLPAGLLGRRAIRGSDCGSWKAPASFEIPEGLRKGYLFEWSPSPLFVPSIGYFGSGELFSFPEQVWGLLEEGDYYSRITDPAESFPRCDLLVWRKAG